LIAIVLLIVAASAACTLPPAYEGGAADGPTVVIVGDSLVSQGSTAIRSALNGEGWRVSLHGEARLATREALPRMVGAAVVQPLAVVVVTTANDAFDMFRGAQRVDEVLAAFDQALYTTRNLNCVVWILLNEHAPFYGFPQWAPWVNLWVAQRAASHANVQLLDWRHEVVNHPSWFQLDRFHHTAAGNVAFAARIVSTVSSCPGFS
jgi:hypothetical protein